MKQEINVKDLSTERDENLHRKEYLIYVYESDTDLILNKHKISPKGRVYKVCSLDELSSTIEEMKRPHWRHPLLKENMTKKEVSAIPFEGKEWGLYYKIEIFPISKEFEKEYMWMNQNKSFDVFREYPNHFDKFSYDN